MYLTGYFPVARDTIVFLKTLAKLSYKIYGIYELKFYCIFAIILQFHCRLYKILIRNILKLQVYSKALVNKCHILYMIIQLQFLEKLQCLWQPGFYSSTSMVSLVATLPHRQIYVTMVFWNQFWWCQSASLPSELVWSKNNLEFRTKHGCSKQQMKQQRQTPPSQIQNANFMFPIRNICG